MAMYKCEDDQAEMPRGFKHLICRMIILPKFFDLVSTVHHLMVNLTIHKMTVFFSMVFLLVFYSFFFDVKSFSKFQFSVIIKTGSRRVGVKTFWFTRYHINMVYISFHQTLFVVLTRAYNTYIHAHFN